MFWLKRQKSKKKDEIMKKILCLFIVGLSFVSSAFRVTKDYGNGIKTFEDSKKKTYGVSVDGGNTWIRGGGVSSSTSTTSRNEELSPEAQALLDKAMEIYNNMMESGQIYVVRGSVVDLYGKRLTLNAKDKVGSMGKDWDNADKFVYLKTLSGVKFKKPEKRLTIEQIRLNRLKRNVFGHVETEEEPSELYKISQTSVSISEWHGNEYGNTRKWKTVYSGYLMNVYEYILLNKLKEGN